MRVGRGVFSNGGFQLEWWYFCVQGGGDVGGVVKIYVNNDDCFGDDGFWGLFLVGEEEY